MLKVRFPKDNIIALLLIAVLIGVVTGFLAVAFRYLLIAATALFWGDSTNLIDAARAMPWYLILLIPTFGGLLIAPIVGYFAPETRGAGVPEVIETAFNAFEGKQNSTLPVVSRVNPKKVIGILKKSSLLMAYNQKVLKHDTVAGAKK